MFVYASKQPEGKFAGDVVVMGNADGIMDESIRHLRNIAKDFVAVLSVTGAH